MADYHIIIQYSEEDGGYIADIPELESCSAFGKTQEEALAQVEQAKQAWLAAARESGRSIPIPQNQVAGPKGPKPAIALRSRKLQYENTKKLKEEMLREEIRSIRGHYISTIQWAFGLLITSSTTLFIMRYLTLNTLKQQHSIPGDFDILPWPYYLTGTFSMTLLATIFYWLTHNLAIKYESYHNQLLKCCPSGVAEANLPTLWWKFPIYYYIFPIIDLLNRHYALYLHWHF